MGDDQGGAAGKRVRYHHGDLRRDLLRAARDEIARRGAEGLSLASLARLAGVSQPAPYRHFADRKALLEAAAAEAFESLTIALAKAMTDKEALEASAALAIAYVSFGEANIELYRLMFASRLTPEALNGSALDDAANQTFGLLRRTLAKGRPLASQSELESEVYRTWAQLHGLVMLKADGFITRPLAHYVTSPSPEAEIERVQTHPLRIQVSEPLHSGTC